MATHTASARPATLTHFGTLRPARVSTSAANAASMNSDRNTTPQVMTDRGLESSRAKRSGSCKPASASSMSSTSPMPTAIGAIR